ASVDLALGSLSPFAIWVQLSPAISRGRTVESTLMKRPATSMNGVCWGGSNWLTSACSCGVSGCRCTNANPLRTLLRNSTGTNETNGLAKLEPKNVNVRSDG